jgi:hypothetical protein
MRAITATRGRKTSDTKRARRAAQVIIIDDDWEVRRADRLNWQIRYKGKQYGFYGTLPSAFQALPSKMLSEEASGTLADIKRSLRGIVERVESAFTLSV